MLTPEMISAILSYTHHCEDKSNDEVSDTNIFNDFTFEVDEKLFHSFMRLSVEDEELVVSMIKEGSKLMNRNDVEASSLLSHIGVGIEVEAETAVDVLNDTREELLAEEIEFMEKLGQAKVIQDYDGETKLSRMYVEFGERLFEVKLLEVEERIG